MDDLVILDEDKAWAQARIAELEAEILALGPEFRDAFTQTSETWHDNAPFEVARDKQAVLAAERHHLVGLLKRGSLAAPKPKRGQVGIGSVVTLRTDKGQTRTIKIAGDWTPNAGSVIDGALITSRVAPIAQAVLGKKAGAATSFGVIETII